MYKTLEEIENAMDSNDGYINTNISMNIDQLVDDGEYETKEIIGEQVFGDFIGSICDIEFEVNRLIGCDVKRQTVELNISIRGSILE